MIDSEKGDYLHLPYEGELMDQPYMTMRILNCIQDCYREIVHERMQQRLKQNRQGGAGGRRRRPRR